MDEQQRAAFLRDEYLHLQKTIEDFDGRAVTIKAWSVTFSFVAIVGAFSTHAAVVLVLASLGSALFWLIEGFWKSFQATYYERAFRIERFFRGEIVGLEPFQIGESWTNRWGEGAFQSLLRIMVSPHVALPHALVTLLGLTLFALHQARLVGL